MTDPWLAAALAGACWGLAPYDGLGAMLALLGARFAALAIAGDRWDLARGYLIGVLWLAGAYAFVPLGWERFASGDDGGRLYVAAVVLHALPLALAFGVARRPILLAPAAIVAEALANELLPMPAGVSVLLVGAPALLAPAAIFGRPVLAGLLLAWGALPWRAAAAALAGWLWFGALWQMVVRADPPDVDVTIVQPDTGAFDGRRPSRFVDHAAAFATLARVPDSLVIAPEGAWSLTSRDLERAFVGTTGTVVVGASWDERNTLAVVTNGVVTERFDKQVLAPLGERKVFGLGRDRYVAGTGARRLTVGSTTVSPLICYEDAVPSAVRGVDASFVVLATNDSWLGPVGAEAHAAMARLLAVESGRWVVRAATSGPSMFVDPSGVFVARTPWLDGDRTPSPGRRLRGRVASRVPAWNGANIAPLTSVIALFSLVAARWRRRPVLS